jgi:hypothetical protein
MGQTISHSYSYGTKSVYDKEKHIAKSIQTESDFSTTIHTITCENYAEYAIKIKQYNKEGKTIKCKLMINDKKYDVAVNVDKDGNIITTGKCEFIIQCDINTKKLHVRKISGTGECELSESDTNVENINVLVTAHTSKTIESETDIKEPVEKVKEHTEFVDPSKALEVKMPVLAIEDKSTTGGRSVHKNKSIKKSKKNSKKNSKNKSLKNKSLKNKSLKNKSLKKKSLKKKSLKKK